MAKNKKLANEADLLKEAIRLGMEYGQKRGVVEFEPTDSANDKIEYIYRLLVHDKLIQPLAKGQPDPGPLKVAAVMSSDGENVILKEATITGKAIKAKASGSLKAEKPAPRFDAKIDILEADLNAYLPAEKKRKAKAKAGPAGPPPCAAGPARRRSRTGAPRRRG